MQKNMEIRYCIEYINPKYPLRDDGSLNVRYDRVVSLGEAEHDLTLILSFGGKILDLYMGNVIDGETGEWNPKPMFVNDDDWFSIKWLEELKHKKLWEPNNEQMDILFKYTEQNNRDGSVLTSLYHDLKRL